MIKKMLDPIVTYTISCCSILNAGVHAIWSVIFPSQKNGSPSGLVGEIKKGKYGYNY
jgi:hypothetical protein